MENKSTIENLKSYSDKIKKVIYILNSLFCTLFVICMILTIGLMNGFNWYKYSLFIEIVYVFLSITFIFFLMKYNYYKNRSKSILYDLDEKNTSEKNYVIEEYLKNKQIFPYKSESIGIFILCIVILLNGVLFFDTYKIKKDNKFLVVYNTKLEIHKELFNIIEEYNTSNIGIKIKLYPVCKVDDDGNIVTDEYGNPITDESAFNVDPFSENASNDCFYNCGKESDIVIADYEDIDNNKKNLFDLSKIEFDRTFISSTGDIKTIQNEKNEIVGIPFCLEGFGFVYKYNPKIDNDTVEQVQDDFFESFEKNEYENTNGINKNRKMAIINEEWPYYHVFSLVNSLNNIEPACEIFENIVNLDDEYCVRDKYIETIKKFVKDDNIRFCFTGTWASGMIEDFSNENPEYEYEFEFIPLLSKEYSTKMVVGPTKYFGINKDSLEKDEAVTFINLLKDRFDEFELVSGLEEPKVNSETANISLIVSMVKNYKESNLYNPLDREMKNLLEDFILSEIINNGNCEINSKLENILENSE